MKKTAVILCVLLSLFVFVSCPAPDNNPAVQDDEYISIVFNPDAAGVDGKVK